MGQSNQTNKAFDYLGQVRSSVALMGSGTSILQIFLEFEEYYFTFSKIYFQIHTTV